MKQKPQKSAIDRLVEHIDERQSQWNQVSEEELLFEIRRLQKLIRPESFGPKKVTVK